MLVWVCAAYQSVLPTRSYEVGIYATLLLYCLPLLLESLLLLVFGVFGASIKAASTLLVPMTVMILCFIMGLQNAVVTKISQAEIRTTHMTGVITDLGIELGKLVYWNRSSDPASDTYDRANHDKLKVLGSILGGFTAGGLAGALAFQHLSYAATIPIALLLAALALVPVLDDLRSALRLRQR